MMAIPNRLVIYAKDITNITGRKPRTARKLLAKIRKHYGKPVDGFVTVEEFSTFTGIREEKVSIFLK